MRLLTDEQLAQVWKAARDGDIAPNANITVDRWGDPFVIFEGWEDVEGIAQIVYSTFPALALEHAPKWDHIPAEYKPDSRHHIEWAIGDFGFSNEHQTCTHCRVAIHTEDTHPYFYYNEHLGDIVCGDCLKNDGTLADDYLSYAARQLGAEAYCVYAHMVDPGKHGFVCVNAKSADLYCAVDDPSDHPDYDHRLDYANEDELKRLGRAARLIDPDLQIVFTYSQAYSGMARIFVRFDPNANKEFAVNDGDNWRSLPLEEISGELLGYAMSRVFAKWADLTMKGGK